MLSTDVENKVRLKVNASLSNMIKLLLNGDMFEMCSFMCILFESETGIIIKANSRFCDYLGYTNEEIHGKTFFDFIIEEDQEKTVVAFEEFMRGEKKTTFFHNNYIHKDGTSKPMYWVRENAHQTGLENYSFSYAFNTITSA